MTVYTKTMMEALAEVRGIQEADLDEGKKEKGPRQLIDPNKEVMVVKKNSVVVIDKINQDIYLKRGWSLAEESDLDEAATSQVLAHGGKGQYKVVSGPAKDGSRETVVKFKGKVVSTGDYDSGADGWYMNIKGKKGQEFFDDAQKMADYFAKNKITEQVVEQLAKIRGNTPADQGRRGAVEDDIERAEKKGDKKEVAKLKEDELDYLTDEELDQITDEEFDLFELDDEMFEDVMKKKSAGDRIKMKKKKDKWAKTAGGKKSALKAKKRSDKVRKGTVKVDKAKSKVAQKRAKLYAGDGVELDEGKMKELHGYIKAGKSAEWIAKKMGVDVKTIKALMSEAWEIGTNEYREYLEKLTPSEVDEASARADAKRSMKSDPSMSQDPFSKDDAATDDDVKGASKNIIMQMRKAVSMRGNFKVEFGDGKKVKIPAKVGQAIQDKYNSIKKPADKEKFQAQVAKSYKDMLNVLKAGYNEEVDLDEATPDYHVKYAKRKAGPYKVTKFMTLDQAKEFLADVKKDGMNGIISKDGKPVKEETILDRIDKKLKERKNG